MYIEHFKKRLERKEGEILYNYVLRLYNIPNINGITNIMKMEFLSEEALNDKNENEGE